ncbi:MAG: N-acetylmuramoyl-L-alanine amidase [Balneolaceae bacterium]
MMKRYGCTTTSLTLALVWALISCLFVILPHTSAFAQNDLNRISAVDRSDGQGLVVRYHLSEAVDSFQVYQPSPDKIQMLLYSTGIDTSGLIFPDEHSSIEEFRLHQIPNGFGVSVQLNRVASYRADAYMDRNGRDLLLGLTAAPPEELISETEGLEPIDWSMFGDEGSGATANLLQTIFDEDYNRLRDNLNFDTVVIDPGHGGRDPGSTGVNGITEKEVNLAVALKLGEYIEENMPGVRVIYTRDDDRYLSLPERGRIANLARGDLFVSVHANSFSQNRNVNGSEVYFMGLASSQSALEVMKRENSVVHLDNSNGEAQELSEEDLIIYELANAGNIAISERIAGKMEHQFRERAQRRSRGVKQAPFFVLYHASMPSLLVETGFITNPNEARFLASEYGQSIMASAIFRAIRDYKIEYDRSREITRSE